MSERGYPPHVGLGGWGTRVFSGAMRMTAPPSTYLSLWPTLHGLPLPLYAHVLYYTLAAQNCFGDVKEESSVAKLRRTGGVSRPAGGGQYEKGWAGGVWRAGSRLKLLSTAISDLMRPRLYVRAWVGVS